MFLQLLIRILVCRTIYPRVQTNMKAFFVSIILFSSLALNAQSQAKLEKFPLQDVTLLPGIFKDAQVTDLKYMMELVPDRLLAPYLREAGLKPKAESYTNWENTGLDGHIGGHYLSALAIMYASTGNKQVLARLNYMIAELKKCQDSFGNGPSDPSSSGMLVLHLTAGDAQRIPHHAGHVRDFPCQQDAVHTWDETAGMVLIPAARNKATARPDLAQRRH